MSSRISFDRRQVLGAGAASLLVSAGRASGETFNNVGFVWGVAASAAQTGKQARPG